MATLILAAAALGIADVTASSHTRVHAPAPPARAPHHSTQPSRSLASAHRANSKPASTPPIPRARPGQAVPILFYHVIAQAAPGTPNAGLWTSPSTFRAQMRYLHAHDYHAVTLQAVWDYWQRDGSLPIHPIVISFDDGFENQYTVALPTLAGYHWPGVLNLALSHFNQPGWGLSTGMVRTMIRDGWEVDSHTMTHADLPMLDPAQLWREIDRSRTILRRTFGIPVNFFCYPYGAYNAAAVADVRRAGYLAATTTQYGLADLSQGAFTLDRIEINSNDGVEGLAAKLPNP